LFQPFGILGGTFDPIHLGHLRTAEEIGQALQLDRVLLIPAASPPHKTQAPIASFAHRLAMARLGADLSPRLEALDIEGKRPGPSYSVETLKELHQRYGPDTELFFIIGMDAFLEIETWKDYLELFSLANVVVIQREGIHIDNPESTLVDLGLRVSRKAQPGIYRVSPGRELRFMDCTRMDISGTRIRDMIPREESIRFLVPDTVRTYIMERGLYRHHAGVG